MKAPGRYIQPVAPGFFDGHHRLAQIQSLGDPLAALNAVMDWTIFVPVLARLPRAQPKAPGGRPACPPLTLFKILVLQPPYGLSDEQAQFQILDRRSFQHFPGLTEADPVPDQNTLREFREKLTRAELFRELFAAFNTRLTRPGFITRKGQISQAIFTAKGTVAQVCEKGVRGQALTKRQPRANRTKSRQRARVEHLFGFKTGSMGAMFRRVIGFARNRARIILTNLVYNLARTGQIIRLKLLGRKTPQLV